MTSEKQQKAVKWCEQFCEPFTGNIFSVWQVSDYLNKHLDEAYIKYERKMSNNRIQKNYY